MTSLDDGGRDRWTPPTEFDGFILERPIGRGGMGRVFLAREIALDRLVAIKFITDSAPGRAARERFLIEARAVARLSHPNVVAIYRIGEVQGRPYIASEYVAGASLERVQKPLPWPSLLSVATALSQGLAEAHRRGVLHRDIKPANVLLGDDGAVKLVDFGLAKLGEHGASAPPPSGESTTTTPTLVLGSRETPELEPDTERNDPGTVSQTLRVLTPVDIPVGTNLTATGAIFGTPLFMAPELWAGDRATARSDVYAAGLLLFELCVGTLPFEHLEGHELTAHVRDVGLPSLGALRPDVPRAFSQAVDRAVSRAPEDRYESAVELAEALAAVDAVFRSFERVASGSEEGVDDASLVSASFARLYPEVDRLFASVYESLFEKDPSLRVLFPMDLAEQRAKLASTIRLAIDSLRRPDKIVPILEDLGRRHVDYGVLPRHLRVFGETLLERLAAFEGPCWDERTAAAWNRAYAAIALAMEQGMLLRVEARSA